MQIGKTLLAKFGLFAPKTQVASLDKADPFTLRLDRISMRECKRQVRQALFRGFDLPQAV